MKNKNLQFNKTLRFFHAQIKRLYRSPIWTLSNILSLSRAPLALVYIFGGAPLRLVSLFLTALSDFFDGYFARKWGQISRLGALLDPIMDKLYVFSVSVFLIYSQHLSVRHFLFFISRDLFLLGIIAYLSIRKELKKVEIRPAWFGKLTTALQLVLFFFVTVGYEIPDKIYWGFLMLGVANACEVFYCLQLRQSVFRSH